MTELVNPDEIEQIVGVPRNPYIHIGRAVTAEQAVYILHSDACLADPSLVDLRACPFSLALDRGVSIDEWTTAAAEFATNAQRGTEDWPVLLGIDADSGTLVPIGVARAPRRWRMSVFMTKEAVRQQIKTVTRRHVDTWRHLLPGDRLTLVEKGQGIPLGGKQVVICEVEVVDVSVEPLRFVTVDEVRREGLYDEIYRQAYAGHPGPTWDAQVVELFNAFWLRGHGYKPTVANATTVECRRIEWRYLDSPEGGAR